MKSPHLLLAILACFSAPLFSMDQPHAKGQQIMALFRDTKFTLYQSEVYGQFGVKKSNDEEMRAFCDENTDEIKSRAAELQDKPLTFAEIENISAALKLLKEFQRRLKLSPPAANEGEYDGIITNTHNSKVLEDIILAAASSYDPPVIENGIKAIRLFKFCKQLDSHHSELVKSNDTFLYERMRQVEECNNFINNFRTKKLNHLYASQYGKTLDKEEAARFRDAFGREILDNAKALKNLSPSDEAGENLKRLAEFENGCAALKVLLLCERFGANESNKKEIEEVLQALVVIVADATRIGSDGHVVRDSWPAESFARSLVCDDMHSELLAQTVKSAEASNDIISIEKGIAAAKLFHITQKNDWKEYGRKMSSLEERREKVRKPSLQGALEPNAVFEEVMELFRAGSLTLEKSNELYKKQIDVSQVGGINGEQAAAFCLAHRQEIKDAAERLRGDSFTQQFAQQKDPAIKVFAFAQLENGCAGLSFLLELEYIVTYFGIVESKERSEAIGLAHDIVSRNMTALSTLVKSAETTDEIDGLRRGITAAKLALLYSQDEHTVKPIYTHKLTILKDRLQAHPSYDPEKKSQKQKKRQPGTTNNTQSKSFMRSIFSLKGLLVIGGALAVGIAIAFVGYAKSKPSKNTKAPANS